MLTAMASVFNAEKSSQSGNDCEISLIGKGNRSGEESKKKFSLPASRIKKIIAL